MKRQLKSKQFSLSDTERESLWHDIRRQTLGAPEAAGRRRTFRPGLAITSIVAVVIFATTWRLGTHQLDDTIVGGGSNQVALFEEMEEMAVPEPALRSAAAPVVASPEVKGGPSPRRESVAAKSIEMVATAPTLTGRIVDRESREALPYAVVRIKGTNLTATTDSLGVFLFENLTPGQDITLEVRLLSYAPETVALNLPDHGEARQDFDLEPVIVATLQSFDVEGAEYMVSVKSAINSRTPPAGMEKRAASATWSVTGGTTPPNGEPFELMYFENFGVNPFVATEDDSLSTFALDVDNASWTLARSYLERGALPPRDAIRVEEFVNAFNAGWPHQSDATFAIHTEGARSRFGEGYHLLRIGLVGKDIPATGRKPANLVFVIDISGSMSSGNRLGLVKQSLHVLLDELAEGDRVGIVVYGSRGEIRLPLTDISRREAIAQAIDGLTTGGSTNAVEGLELAYRMARENYDAKVVNRLILCSDGVANTGTSTEAGGILAEVRKASDEGITLSTIGVGMGNYNDVMMEKLADQGDGNYYYVDRPAEGERVFRENLTGLLQTIAREAKVQVAFNDDLVQRWRLLGYENRDVADEDFRNDAVDAGEVGAGHQVSALYELKLKQPADREGDADVMTAQPPSAPALRVGTVHLRWQAPAHDTRHAGQVQEIAQPILLSEFSRDFGAGSPAMRVQTVVAEFAEILRGSYWSKGNTAAALVPIADALASEMPADTQVRDLARLVRLAADLMEREK